MNSGPICAMVWEDKNVVKMGRMIWVKPIHKPPSQVPSVVTSQSKLDATSATVPMPSNLPTPKSHSGSNQKNSSHGTHAQLPGLTNKLKPLFTDYCALSVSR